MQLLCDNNAKNYLSEEEIEYRNMCLSFHNVIDTDTQDFIAGDFYGVPNVKSIFVLGSDEKGFDSQINPFKILRLDQIIKIVHDSNPMALSEFFDNFKMNVGINSNNNTLIEIIAMKTMMELIDFTWGNENWIELI